MRYHWSADATKPRKENWLYVKRSNRRIWPSAHEIDDGLRFAQYHPDPATGSELDEKQDARIIALACSEPAAGPARRTLELLTKEVLKDGIVTHISAETVRLLLKNKLNSLRYRLVGGTRGRRFAGTHSRPRKRLENAATPTSRVGPAETVVQQDRHVLHFMSLPAAVAWS